MKLIDSIDMHDEPIYIKNQDVSMFHGNTLITICDAACKVIKNKVAGAYGSSTSETIMPESNY